MLTTNVRGDGFVWVGTEAPGAFDDNCRHQAAVSRSAGDGEAGEVRLHVDGEPVATASGTFGQTAVSAAPFTIGYRLDSEPRAFGGSLDEIQIYDRVLGDAEIREH